MLQRSSSDSSAAGSATHTGAHPRRHLLSTFVIAFWTLFIILTVVIHEVAYRASWDFEQARYRWELPWFLGPRIGIPTIMRTAFTQAHGPITAMHLARLAVNTLKLPWSSPKTWIEVFWLADRRWAGPVGLGKTGWTIASRRLRVSFGFLLLAALNIVAVITPVFMTRTYSMAAGDAQSSIVGNVSTVDLSIMSRLTRGAQLSVGNEIWSKGLPPKAMFPPNTYTGTLPTGLEKWLFLSGDSYASDMRLTGILVGGECYAWTDQVGHTCYRDETPKSWDFDAKPLIPDSNSTNISLTSGLSCSIIDLSMPFGQVETRSDGSPIGGRDWRDIGSAHVSFEFSGSAGDFVAFCLATVVPGIASVDGRDMIFSNFEYTRPHFDESIPPQKVPVHPLAAVVQADWLSFERSINLKLDRIIKKPDDYSGALEVIIGDALWDGVLAMSSAMWLLSEAPPKETIGIQRVTKIGMQRNVTFLYVLMSLLGVWFFGMLVATALLLRPTWTSSLDGYAAARMLLHRPELAIKPESWFADLEENSDMLEPFDSNQMRGPSGGLARRPPRDAF